MTESVELRNEIAERLSVFRKSDKVFVFEKAASNRREVRAGLQRFLKRTALSAHSEVYRVESVGEWLSINLPGLAKTMEKIANDELAAGGMQSKESGFKKWKNIQVFESFLKGVSHGFARSSVKGAPSNRPIRYRVIEPK